MIFLILWTVNSLNINKPQTLIFDKSPIFVNEFKYRESINPIYFLYFKKGNYNLLKRIKKYRK